MYVRACVKIEMRRRGKKQNRVKTEAQTDIKKEKGGFLWADFHFHL